MKPHRPCIHCGAPIKRAPVSIALPEGTVDLDLCAPCEGELGERVTRAAYEAAVAFLKEGEEREAGKSHLDQAGGGRGTPDA